MNTQSTLPRVAIGSLGGTVSMQAAAPGQGVTPQLDCQALLSALPQLGGLARFTSASLCLLPSPSLSFCSLLEVLAWAQRQVEEGAQAVVLTQGTDTLEESAYFLDLLWPFDAPLVLTGAMRPASHPGADGPANLLAAVQVALADTSRGRGALVVMHEQIHRAAEVRKCASLALAAFDSPGAGPTGQLVEGLPIYRHGPLRRRTLPVPARTSQRVALLEACLDADTTLLQAVADQGYDGLVVAGFGAGHVSAQWAECMAVIARQLPVIVATRTGNGATARATYGFVGSEIDLQTRGMQMAGALCPRKCRILLWLLLGMPDTTPLSEWLAR